MDGVLYLLTKNDEVSFIVIDVGMKVVGDGKRTKSRDESALLFYLLAPASTLLPPSSRASLHGGIWTYHGPSRRFLLPGVSLQRGI